MPRHVDWPSPARVSWWTTSYVSVPLRDTTPTGPGVQMCPGRMPTFDWPGVMSPGQLGPTSRGLPAVDARATPRDVVIRAQRVAHRHALGDAHDEPDPRVGRLVHRVRRERRGHVDHRGVGLGGRHGLGDAVEHRHAVHLLAALAGRHARDDLGAVL